MYRTIRLYGSKIINIVRLSSFLRIRTLCVLFIQLIRDFFYFHFKECCFFENQKIDSIRRWMDEHYCDMVPATFPSLQEKSNEENFHTPTFPTYYAFVYYLIKAVFGWTVLY